MSAAVETMAYTNQVPWHGLGARVDKATSVADMIKKAGLDWRVERRPLMAGVYVDKGGELAPDFGLGSPKVIVNDFAALVRDKDNAVLDVVGSRYTPRQNADVFKFFKEFVEAGKATMETAGSLRGGRIVWGLANLKAGFKLAGGDEVKGYLLVASFHQQGKANVYKFTAVRVVCANTLALALNSVGGFKDYHSSEFTEETTQRAKKALGIAREQLSEFEKNAKALKKLHIPPLDVVEIFGNEYQPNMDWGKRDLKVPDLVRAAGNAKLKEVWRIYEHAPGADPGTGWGVLNAVTYYIDHVASRSPDKRLTNAWFGRTAMQKERVFATLMERV
jgi:phage/plasmid-like protein (TIGR03299 family)